MMKNRKMIEPYYLDSGLKQEGAASAWLDEAFYFLQSSSRGQ
jgi:hypothetical protein